MTTDDSHAMMSWEPRKIALDDAICGSLVSIKASEMRKPGR